MESEDLTEFDMTHTTAGRWTRKLFQENGSRVEKVKALTEGSCHKLAGTAQNLQVHCGAHAAVYGGTRVGRCRLHRVDVGYRETQGYTQGTGGVKGQIFGTHAWEGYRGNKQ